MTKPNAALGAYLNSIQTMKSNAALARRLDSWTNLVSKMGVVGRDKRMSSTVDDAPIFKVREEMSALYHGNDLAKKIVDLPVQEMFRRWIRLRSSAMSQKDAITMSRDVLDYMESKRIKSTLEEAMTWAKLYGGACVFMGIRGAGAVNTPLEPMRAKSLEFLTVFDRHEIRVARYYADPLKANYGKPELYEIVSTLNDADVRGSGLHDHKTGQIIHASRMLVFEGTRTDKWRKRQFNGGWSDSVFVSAIATLRGHDSVWMSSESLMQDFAQAVIKLQGLSEAMSTNGEDNVMTRLELMDTSRSVLRALVLDAEHEDFERKPTPMTGLADVIDRWMHRLSAATSIPVTLLYGRSPAGQNATGESDFRIFYDKIAAEQERDLRPELERLLEVIFNVDDGPTKGAEPESWQFDFLPLWQLNALEESQRRKAQAETDEIYVNTGVLTPQAVTRSRFGGDDYSTETMVDEEAIAALEETNQARQELELNPPEPTVQVPPNA